MRMTAQQAKEFAGRWRAVNEAEREELRATPFAQKFAQLAALVDSARALGWETTDPAEVEEVRARWQRLASLYVR